MMKRCNQRVHPFTNRRFPLLLRLQVSATYCYDVGPADKVSVLETSII